MNFYESLWYHFQISQKQYNYQWAIEKWPNLLLNSNLVSTRWHVYYKMENFNFSQWCLTKPNTNVVHNKKTIQNGQPSMEYRDEVVFLHDRIIFKFPNRWLKQPMPIAARPSELSNECTSQKQYAKENWKNKAVSTCFVRYYGIRFCGCSYLVEANSKPQWSTPISS